MLKKPYLKVQNLQYKFLDWKLPPPPFGTFPKIHPFWRRHPSLIVAYVYRNTMLLKPVWRSRILETLAAGGLWQLWRARHIIGSHTLSATNCGIGLIVLGEVLWGSQTPSMTSLRGELSVFLLLLEHFNNPWKWRRAINNQRLWKWRFCHNCW